MKRMVKEERKKSRKEKEMVEEGESMVMNVLDRK